ncbi:putative snf2 family atp-dependent chromatin-remodeling factor snf21 protein [Phaeoacremonium minimum UCRPA7]|uniref:Putative snf2 family atp-dependent chromatin-remodeling factor snf21 protein n=1 Tax=Phaeoacremonium minimum (strain UCR-PA7) TaxID=1286976 RepID=R8BTV1_PHAM7|nr:putative snf2 family atp-dependent chromatin-remodeling factor snf21 protein [Phaeoacremonium minimum UCRPA7]EOO02813.1 putative snf2 family atp-dependent chromatin-remodeling factor snf21 protein [Phaeoacremonium minimum UCRPA7]
MPGEVVDDDPFDWDVDRVIKELCSSDRTWDAPPASKLPDPVKLSQQLIDHDIDGETLLGWGDSDNSLQRLCIALGVSKIRHQHSIIQAIKFFRTRSPRWKKSTTLDPQQDSDVEMTEKHCSVSKSPSLGNGDSRILAVIKDETYRLSTLQKETGGSVINEKSEEGLPKKRKRIAPINTSTLATGIGSKTFPTEADQWIDKRPGNTSITGLRHLGAQGEFLGSGKLSAADVLHPDPDGSDPDVKDRDFSWILTGFIPPARRVQVNHIMKRHLRHNALSFGKADGLHLDDDDDDDEILPAFGESGDENEYDEETWREIQEEASEQNEHVAGSKYQYLNSEEVDAIVQQAIEDLKSTWLEVKLPRYKKKAYKMWMDARQHGSRGHQITFANERVHDLELRIANLCKHIYEQKWARADQLELQRQTACLEQSVFEREHSAWIIRVLNSPTAPEKPAQPARLTTVRQSKPPKVRKSGNGDEELLTSASEDDLDDFVVDDQAQDFDPDPFIVSSKQTIVSKHTNNTVSSEDRQYAPIARGMVTGNSQTGDDTEMLDLTNNDEPPDYADVATIAEMGTKHWQLVGDNERQIIAVLYNSAPERRRTILRYALNYNVGDAWDGVIMAALKNKACLVESSPSTPRSKQLKARLGFTRIFDLYISGHSDVKNNRPVNNETARKIESKKSEFDNFFAFLRSVADFFPVNVDLMPSSQKAAAFDEHGSPPSMQNGEAHDIPSDVPTDEDMLSPSKRRKRQIIRDEAAQNLRDTDKRRVETQEARRKILRERLKITDSMSQDVTRLIINETRNDEEGFIYINKMIASRIKDHQIEGVRFMWDRLIAGSSAKQGCLLAHTMGLGKTMQIITLLVAIAEAAASPDPSINSQIPEELKESKTLVLCPAGLVDNWMDELLTWTPDKMTLGDLRKIDSSQKDPERTANLRAWAEEGGVLVIGYPMFTRLANKDEFQSFLFDVPNIVVGDEAHKLQNPHAKVHKAAKGFRTTFRIAMTGSPLANNVEEYHSMINWVAPNYLGPLNEFKAFYADPIRDGLYEDSSPSERRKAFKMLKVLKQTVAPKVHRATIAALRETLPPKREFILYLKLTERQFDAYLRFVRHLKENPKAQDKGNTLFQLIGTLSLLLAHPKIFRAKLEQRKALDKDQQKSKSIANVKEDRGDLPAEVLTVEVLSNLLATLPKETMEAINASYKMAVLVKILDQAKLMGEKVLVFSQYLDTLDYIENLCREQKRLYLRLDGSTAPNVRLRDVKQFNTGKDEVYLISTLAGGVGLNIPGASRVVIFDYKFNPIAEQQAIGRAYRLGQTKPVYVYWLVFDGTFERNLQNQAIFKLQLQSRVVDQKNPIARAQKAREYCRDPVNVVPQNLDSHNGMDRILDAVLEDDALSSHITSIDMTDTFDEEEPEEQLTAEDSKEIEKLILRNQLRWQNPEEYRRLEQQDGALQHNQSLVPSIVQPTDSPTPVDRARSAQTLLTENSLPLMGTGTGFRTRAAPQITQSFIDVPDSFASKFRDSLVYRGEGVADIGVRQERARTLATEVEGIIGERHPQGLPMMDAWRRVMDKIANSEILAAFLAGEISPGDFVFLQVDQLLARQRQNASRGNLVATTGARNGRGDPNV